MTDLNLSDVLAGLQGAAAEPWTREWLDERARHGEPVGRISNMDDPLFPGGWKAEIAAAEAAGYGLRKIRGRGTAMGVIILTARTPRAARLLQEGRRRALKRELGCSEDEARALEPVCRSGWVRERADQMLEHLRWLLKASTDAAANTLNMAWRRWTADGQSWGEAVKSASTILELNGGSCPRTDALLQAAFALAHRERGWVPPEIGGDAARNRWKEIQRIR